MHSNSILPPLPPPGDSITNIICIRTRSRGFTTTIHQDRCLQLARSAIPNQSTQLQYASPVPHHPCWEQHLSLGHSPLPLLPPPQVAGPAQCAAESPHHPDVEQHFPLAQTPFPTLPKPHLPPGIIEPVELHWTSLKPPAIKAQLVFE